MPLSQYHTRQWSFIDHNKPCPFEEILAPLVDAAHRRYEEQAGSSYALLNTESHLTLQRHLLQILASLSLQTLHTEFSKAYTQARTLSAEKQHKQPLDEQTFYKHFIAHMLDDGMVILFNQYPALARLLAVTCDHWVEANVEFLQRLHNDWAAIEQTFGIERPLGQVTNIQPALSDSHNGRRTVMALTFESGDKLVYKPRNIGMEESYYRLLSWCNEQGINPSFKTLTMLNRSSYGWMEFVEQESCEDERAIQRYYQRAGMLLFLVYVLGGVNCTYEHLIAHGEHPMLVDAGILLHAYPAPTLVGGTQQGSSDWEAHTYSVLHTGLLTNWRSPLKTGRSSDISTFAIGANTTQQEQQARSRQQQIALKYGALKVREHLNIPFFKNVAAHAEDYKEDIIEGFRQLYLLLLSKQATQANSAFQHFKHQQARMLYRPTWTYGAILSQLLTPENLRNGIDHRSLIEQAGQYLIPVEYAVWGKGDWSHWQPLARSELHALTQGDIPFFTRHTDSRSLIISDNSEITNCFHQAGFDMMVSRLQALSHADMSRQISYVERVLRTKDEAVAAQPTVGIAYVTTLDGHATVTEKPLHQTFVNEALHVADTLFHQAILLPDGGATWLHTKFLMRSQYYQYRPMGYSLFDGLSGVALFLAAAAKISGDARYHKLSLAAVQTIRQQVQDYGHLLVGEMGIGGGIGLGSVVYALTRISQFLDEPDLLIDAKRAAALITAEQIAYDKALDIIAGSAGTILGLLALYDASQDQSVLAQAILCGQHLLQSRTMSKADCLVWPTLGEKHVTGFAHGIAGIAYAVLRLYNVTHDAQLLEAAEEALRYENAAFLSNIDNWTEELGDSESMVMATWCHGAPGIGLARLGGLSSLDTPRIRNDIEAALRTTQRIPLVPLDFLCCGNLGRAELLLAAGQQLGRPELTETARQNAWRVVARAQQQGGFNLNKALPSWVNIPNFFHGISGIGYELLRMADPDVIPSALLWM